MRDPELFSRLVLHIAGVVQGVSNSEDEQRVVLHPQLKERRRTLKHVYEELVDALLHLVLGQ